MKLDVLRHNAGDVDQARRCVHATLHIPQQRLAAGEQQGTLLEGKLAGLVERYGVAVYKVAHDRPSWVLPRHCPGSRRNRLDDVVIASTAADVALELLADRRLIRFAKAARDVERDHHHARGAVAALKRMMLPKGRLHGMERLAGPGKGLDGGDGRPLALQCKHRARLHRQTVHMHDAGAALCRVAADMRAGKTQMLPEKLHEHRPPFDLAADGTAATISPAWHFISPVTNLAWSRARFCRST